MFFLGKSRINLLTNSSTKEDFPAPPVPVIPNTGVLDFVEIVFIFERIDVCFLGSFQLPISYVKLHLYFCLLLL